MLTHKTIVLSVPATSFNATHVQFTSPNFESFGFVHFGLETVSISVSFDPFFISNGQVSNEIILRVFGKLKLITILPLAVLGTHGGQTAWVAVAF
jgi:hypothetical protein